MYASCPTDSHVQVLIVRSFAASQLQSLRCSRALTGRCVQEAGKEEWRASKAMVTAAGTGAEAQGRRAQAAALAAWRACLRVQSWAARLWAPGRCLSWLLVCDAAHTAARYRAHRLIGNQ